MKKTVKFCSLLLVLTLAMSIGVYAQAKKKASGDKVVFEYEIEAMGFKPQGTYLIKVWSYFKQAKLPISQAKKNAVHGVIFKGIPGKQGVPAQNAFATPAIEDQKSDFFDKFFSDGGDFQKYVTESGDGTIAAEDIIKIGKQYKIGVVVEVNVTELKKTLVNSGIIAR